MSNAIIHVKDNQGVVQTVYPKTSIANVEGLQTALNGKVNTVSGKGLSTEDYTTAEKTKLSGIAAGATANIGTVTTVKVGSTSYSPSSGVISLPAYPSDTNTHRPIQMNGTEILGNNTTALNLKAGSNVSLSNSSGTVTIAATDTTYSAATQSANGLMSSTDKTKLDGIATGANNYAHPTSSGNKHIPSGGSSGQILRWSADGTAAWGSDNNTWTAMVGATSSANGSVGYVNAVPPKDGYNTKYLRADGSWQVPPNTTYSAATQSANGLMSSSDKTKLDGIATGAQVNSITGVKGNSESSYRTGNVNLTAANVGAAASSHTHGNIQNGGTLQTNDITIASGDKLVVTDSSDSSKIARTSISFDGSTTTQALTKAGSWQTFNNYSHPTSAGNKHIPSGGSSGQILTYGGSSGTASWASLAAASQSSAGLMSAADKLKLDGIATEANKITFVQKRVTLSDLTWTQSMGGLYYSSKVLITGVYMILGITPYDFAYLRDTDWVYPIIFGDTYYNGIGFHSGTNTFIEGAYFDLIVFGIVQNG